MGPVYPFASRRTNERRKTSGADSVPKGKIKKGDHIMIDRKTIKAEVQKMRDAGMTGTVLEILSENARNRLATLNEYVGGTEARTEQEKRTAETPVRHAINLYTAQRCYERLDHYKEMTTKDATKEYISNQIVKTYGFKYDEETNSYSLPTDGKDVTVPALAFIKTVLPAETARILDAIAIFSDNCVKHRESICIDAEDHILTSRRSLSPAYRELKERMGWDSPALSNNVLKGQLNQLWAWMLGDFAPKSTSADVQWIYDSVRTTKSAGNKVGEYSKRTDESLTEFVFRAAFTRIRSGVYKTVISKHDPETPLSVTANEVMGEKPEKPQATPEVVSETAKPGKPKTKEAKTEEAKTGK